MVTGLNSLKNLYKYQLSAASFILSHPRCALFLEMGLGKTVITLTAVEKLLFDYCQISKVLVIAPKRVAESVWMQEATQWEHLRHLKITRVIGTAKERLNALNTPSDIWVVGRDNISWLFNVLNGRQPFDMIILDELSSYKNPKSVRFKTLKCWTVNVPRIVGLTGTPSPNGYIDLWSQIFLLDRGKRLFPFIGQFRANFFVPSKFNGLIVYKYKLTDRGYKEIPMRINDICLSMKAQDYLQLPMLINDPIYIDLPSKTLEQYKQFKDDYYVKLGGEEITAANAGVLTVKLLQYANGAIYSDDSEKSITLIHDKKIEATKEIVEALNGQPLIIAWSFKHDRARLIEALNQYNPRQLQSDKDVQDWNAGKIQVLLMHPASGGHGLNLQYGGNHILWYGLTYSLELFQQLNARLYRQGQQKPVFIHQLVCRQTIDEIVIKSQRKKDLLQSLLMTHLKSEA